MNHHGRQRRCFDSAVLTVIPEMRRDRANSSETPARLNGVVAGPSGHGRSRHPCGKNAVVTMWTMIIHEVES